MSSLELSNVSKTFSRRAGAVPAVDDVSLRVEQGELFVLLGESGCGKTTLLRCIAGLESATAGSIRFGDKVVYDRSERIDLPPYERDLGMVFQSYALWPHMTVRDNLSFPLRAARCSKRETSEMVEQMAAVMQCPHLLDRYPGQLSGGQQQRIALGRALIARPAVVLFDEPLSNLDALLRRDLRAELRSLHERLQFTGIYVTHDQVEALTVGDRIGVMSGGQILQSGSPSEVYHSPLTTYVAGFFGMSNEVSLRDVGAAGSLDPSLANLGTGDERTVLRFRPEHTRLFEVGASVPDDLVRVCSGTATSTMFAGHLSDTTVETAGGVIAARLPLDKHAIPFAPGATVDVAVERSGVAAYVDGLLSRTAGPPPSDELPPEMLLHERHVS